MCLAWKNNTWNNRSRGNDEYRHLFCGFWDLGSVFIRANKRLVAITLSDLASKDDVQGGKKHVKAENFSTGRLGREGEEVFVGFGNGVYRLNCIQTEVISIKILEEKN